MNDKYICWLSGLLGTTLWIDAHEPLRGIWKWDGLYKGYISTDGWGPGQPSNYQGKEDCMSLYVTTKWNDAPCNDRYRYICEKRITPWPWTEKTTTLISVDKIKIKYVIVYLDGFVFVLYFISWYVFIYISEYDWLWAEQNLKAVDLKYSIAEIVMVD